MERRDLTEDLPAPRDDEPSNLRQDIADELLDHLQCALNRELHRTPDEQAAKQSVLERFGNPRQIARRLWLDAMQERIMTQRIMLGMSLLTAVVCLVALGVVWRIAEDSRAANLAMIAEAKTANQALLSKLNHMTEATAAAPENLEWSKVQIKVVEGENGRTPVHGCKVDLVGLPDDTATNAIRLAQPTDDSGIADFGLIRVGSYNIALATPWNEFRPPHYFYVHPKHEEAYEFFCPPETMDGEVTFQVHWPDDLAPDHRLFIYASFNRTTEKFADWNNPQTRGSLMISSTGVFHPVTLRRGSLDVNRALYDVAVFGESSLRLPQQRYLLHIAEVISDSTSAESATRFRSVNLMPPKNVGRSWSQRVPAKRWIVEFTVKQDQQNLCQLEPPDWVLEKLQKELAKDEEAE